MPKKYYPFAVIIRSFITPISKSEKLIINLTKLS